MFGLVDLARNAPCRGQRVTRAHRGDKTAVVLEKSDCSTRKVEANGSRHQGRCEGSMEYPGPVPRAPCIRLINVQRIKVSKHTGSCHQVRLGDGQCMFKYGADVVLGYAGRYAHRL